MRFLIAVPLFVVAALLAAYGLIALLYTGEGTGHASTYVTIAAHRIDAHLAGGLCLAIAAIVTVVGILVVRRPRSHT